MTPDSLSREQTAVRASAGAKRAESVNDFVRVEIPEEGRASLWKLISDNEWSGEYLGKNVFVFSEEQLNRIQEAGISFRAVA